MGRQFLTSHVGLAAYLLCEGGEVLDLETKKLMVNGTQVTRPYFTFNLSDEAGRKVATEYFDNTKTVEPLQYFKHIGDLRSKIYLLKNPPKIEPTTE